ncbi:MAG: tryptophan synthase subunit alpha [Pelagibacterales bacterium]|nr:tryptophan synthase subunit alpha [Pelagibacterales bacterium]
MNQKNRNYRIEKKFGDLKKANRAALITFVTAGDPDINTSKKILLGLPEAGADLIEIGVPFSDPMADGPIIQKSYKRALKNGVTLDKVLGLVKDFRKKNDHTPIVLMGYYNPIYQKGLKLFFREAEKVGVDGVLIVDFPPENDEEIEKYLNYSDIKFIRLATPTTDRGRLNKILKISSGFLYYVSITGITGTDLSNLSNVKSIYKKLSSYSKIPIVVGFGINTPEKATNVSKFADGVVIGSTIVNEINKTIDKKNHLNKNVFKLVKRFSGAIMKARKN